MTEKISKGFFDNREIQALTKDELQRFLAVETTQIYAEVQMIDKVEAVNHLNGKF